MNADEIQYALDRRNEVDLPLSDPDTDNVITKPIQLGHLTGDVFIYSSNWARLNYLGPPGRAVFEYNYTGSQDPPRIFFEHIVSLNKASGTYNKENISFLRVIQPNTSPKAIFARHCDFSNNGTYLFDGPDVSGCDGIQIKHCTGSGPAFIRWRLRHDSSMLFLEINNTRYQTGSKVGPSTDLKNTRGVQFLVFADEQRSSIMSALNGNWAAPLSHRFVNPRGFNKFQHNWNEYATIWDIEAPGCWGTSIRVDDESGDYGMHFIRGYQTPFRGGTSSTAEGVKIVGGHSSSNAGSLYVEAFDAFNFQSGDDDRLFAGKCFPKQIDGWDLDDAIAASFTDLNSDGIENRLDVYDADGQPRLHGNTRTYIYNTEYRLDRTDVSRDYEDVLLSQSYPAYGDVNSVSTLDGSDVVIKFTGSGTLTVTEEIQVEVLLQAGGGSGGAKPPEDSQVGGGGGAGGFYSNYGGTKITLSPGQYPVVVGDGGQFTWGNYGQGSDGEDTSFNGITVPGGGGGGGSVDGVTFTDGRPGGCGGGASAYGGKVGGSGSAYGYAGGSSTETAGSATGASGGGGVGGVGGDGTYSSGTRGGDGGIGIASSITGTSVVYGEGGGGSTTNNFLGDGGTAGGGWPRTVGSSSQERDGKKNLGGGGAGGTVDTTTPVALHYPGNGGSGVVIIRVSGA